MCMEEKKKEKEKKKNGYSMRRCADTEETWSILSVVKLIPVRLMLDRLLVNNLTYMLAPQYSLCEFFGLC